METEKWPKAVNSPLLEMQILKIHLYWKYTNFESISTILYLKYLYLK